ncbi:MAG: hypothetical protein M0Q92_00115 [Methanoregula sp.]|nr:hypothetical protein [Methanoregula sp.]
MTWPAGLADMVRGGSIRLTNGSTGMARPGSEAYTIRVLDTDCASPLIVPVVIVSVGLIAAAGAGLFYRKIKGSP